MNAADRAVKWLQDQGLEVPTRPPAAWVGSVIPAAVWATDPGNPIADAAAAAAMGLEPARSAVVVMVDGLGLASLRDHMSYAKNLRSIGDGAPAQTTVPSTTAAALTAFMTGALPGDTSMVGYAVGRGDHTMNLLNFEPAVAPEQWQAVPTYFERQGQNLGAALITREKFRGSGLTRAAFRGGDFLSAARLEERLALAARGVAAGRRLQVVYWSDIDHTGHACGVGSDKWTAKLEELDSALGAFLSRLASDVTVVLTADHGMVNVDRIIDVADHRELSDGLAHIAGEGRAVHLHPAGDVAADDLLERWSDFLGDQAVVVPTSGLAPLMGDGPALDLVGAGVAFMRQRTVVLDSRVQPESVFKMRGVHGSLTFDEMAIPAWRLA